MDGRAAKAQVVAAHQPGGSAKFVRVDMDDYVYINHGGAVVVTCRGVYENAQGEEFSLRFMRVWARKPQGWRIIAGSILPTQSL